jgi:hypothetical protein
MVECWRTPYDKERSHQSLGGEIQNESLALRSSEIADAELRPTLESLRR